MILNFKQFLPQMQFRFIGTWDVIAMTSYTIYFMPCGTPCVCVCIYIYIYIHTYIHMYGAHTYVYIYVYIYIYIYIVCVCIHIYIYIYIYTHAYVWGSIQKPQLVNYGVVKSDATM